MRGRVFVKTTIPDMVRRFEFAHPGDVERMGNVFPIWNGAPSPSYPIIIGEESLGRLSKPLSSCSTIEWSESTHFARMWITPYR
ncbi:MULTISPECIES: hypothetical protein [unclassified Mesorhizobium]|uniref:hypothetical protein n=1 Tax=unclassified Mesorhizobium TaxID=325217 RepID=UPI001CD14E5C|nr:MULTISPECIES: hypothetical protein [unclassified Mesorhizobium]MBZ9889035.1 hypothetical protein [Mesorhizobium sp. BR1-1-3]